MFNFAVILLIPCSSFPVAEYLISSQYLYVLVPVVDPGLPFVSHPPPSHLFACGVYFILLVHFPPSPAAPLASFQVITKVCSVVLQFLSPGIVPDIVILVPFGVFVGVIGVPSSVTVTSPTPSVSPATYE